MTERQAVLLWAVVGIALFLGVGVSVCLVTYTVVDTAASQELRVQVLELKTALENLTGTVDSVDTASPAPGLLTAAADLSAKLDHVVSTLSHVQTQTQELHVTVDGLSSRVDTNSRAASDVKDRSLGLQTRLDALSSRVDTNTGMMSENARLRNEIISKASSLDGLRAVVSNLTSLPLLHCRHYQELGLPSGVYIVDPQDGQPAFPAFCDMDTEGGPWLVFQRRKDGSVNFTRNWDDYTSGFGDLRGEFWLGLEKLHRLTSAGMSQLRVDLATWWGRTGHALYSTFRVSGSSDNFRLEVHGYSGTAGDDMYDGNNVNFTANGMQFNSYDRDNDRSREGYKNCAQEYKAGWWYNWCHRAHPNGVYGSRGSVGGHYVYWGSFPKSKESLKFVEMKIK